MNVSFPAAPDAKAEALGKSESDYIERFTKTTSTIIIVNGVPYIIILEYGHSKQAPQGFVRITMRQLAFGMKTYLKGYAKDVFGRHAK